MNRYIFLFLIAAFSLLLHAKCVAQNNIVYGAGISYTNGVPTFIPPAKSARVAIDTVTSKWYEYATPGGWRWSGDRVQDISGCSAPAYTPGKAQSRLVLNNCTAAQNGHGPEMYKYTGSAWLCLNCETGGGVYTGGEGIVVDSPSIRIDTLDRVTFATSPTLPGGVGTVRWNDTDGTIEVGMKGGNVTQQVGQEQLVLVKHADNSGLANGNVVYVVGSDGTNKTVRLARADAESTSANTFGVMTEAATGGNKAFCTTFGLVRDLNTSALTEGAMVWLSDATAGAMTTTRPTAPNHAVQIGFCIRSHATQGVIFVSVQNGYELGELHDVSVTGQATGQALIYNTNKWVNGTLPDASATNELQTISTGTNTLTLSNSGGTVTVDTDPTNDITSLSGGTGISISGSGNSRTITNTGDLSNTNELQTLSISNDTLSISDGNNVVLPTPSSTLDDLTDVTITSPADGQVLTYNSGLWQNSAIGITWPLLAPNGSSAAPSYSFSTYPGSGMYSSVSFSEPRLNIVGGNGVGSARGGSLFGVAGASESGAPGRIIYVAGASSGNSGGAVTFTAGSTTSANSSHIGGTVTFSSGTSTFGKSGDIIFNIGGGVTKGFVRFGSAYTPTSSADSNGSTGSFSWDDNYIYIKTSTGWKRTALSSF